MELFIVLALFVLIVATWLFLPSSNDGMQPTLSELVSLPATGTQAQAG